MTTTNSTITVNDGTVNDGTVNLQGTLLKLDGLVDAYSAILEQATEQLETLELSSQQIDQITNKAANQIDYYRVAVSVISAMRVADDNGMTALKRISDDVFENVRRSLNSTIADIVKWEVRTAMAELRVNITNEASEQINIALANVQYNEMRDARTQRNTMKALFDLLYKEEMTDWIRSSASELADQYDRDRQVAKAAAEAAATESTIATSES